MSSGPPVSESFVTVENVSKKFKSVIAVQDVSLQIPAAVIFGFVGSDGAGKSTLLRMIATMIPPDTGRITIDGMDVTSRKGGSRAGSRRRSGTCPRSSGFTGT